MDYLPFFLSVCRLWGKVPHLLLLPDSAGEPQAAVLLYEYGMGRMSSGIFVPADLCGERTVIAPEPLRSMIAWRAAEVLIDRGAHLVFLTLRNGDFTSADFAGSPDLNRVANLCDAAAYRASDSSASIHPRRDPGWTGFSHASKPPPLPPSRRIGVWGNLRARGRPFRIRLSRGQSRLLVSCFPLGCKMALSLCASTCQVASSLGSKPRTEGGSR